MGRLMRWLGGIPVDRGNAGDMVGRMSAEFDAHDDIVLAITPEGTRSKVKKWKTGFYRIAVGAQVPIVLAFLDFERKVGGVGPTIYPSGDFDADMKKIMDFYAGIKGCRPDQG